MEEEEVLGGRIIIATADYNRGANPELKRRRRRRRRRRRTLSMCSMESCHADARDRANCRDFS